MEEQEVGARVDRVLYFRDLNSTNVFGSKEQNVGVNSIWRLTELCAAIGFYQQYF